MSKKYPKCPKCGSIRIAKAPSGDMGFCLACESILNTIDGKSKPTVFDTITVSPEVLAKKTVHPIVVTDLCTGNRRMCYYSPIVDQRYESEPEAIAATVARLKEVCNERH